jgi:thymidylate synthase
MRDGFPILTTKKVHFKSVLTELLWFLRGDTNIKYLLDNDCNIWNGDAYKNYCNEYKEDKWMKKITLNLPFPNKSYCLYTQEEFIEKIKTDDEFAKKWGELGPIYGKQWRSWVHGKQKLNKEENKFWMEFEHYDQIIDLIQQLKYNPDSRRMIVNAWNVSDLPHQVLPPCHYSFQVYTRELSLNERIKISELNTKIILGFDSHEDVNLVLDTWNIPKRAISLMFNARSQDVLLGTPFNISSYGLLLEILAKITNMVPDQLIGNLGDVHLYNNHIEQAKEQIGRTSFDLPTINFNPIFLTNLEHKGLDEAINDHINIQLENYQSHPAIKAPLSN